MDEPTIRALRESIQHWRENERAAMPGDASAQSDDCALCQKFKADYCLGCPVEGYTGKKYCGLTPYEDASIALHAWWKAPSKQTRDAFHAAARAEREFLESLLPEGEKP
jgi:hypothetical protein